jgi:hypothetical protein
LPGALAGAAESLRHASAHQGDRYCAACGAALPATGMMQTAIDKLRELRALHEDGLLSRQEFDSRKNAILDAAYAPPGGRRPRCGAPGAQRGTEIGLMAGQEVGPFERRYRLERLIAHGGMGQVWQATDLATQAELGHSAQVALKILPPQLTQNTAHARLLIEEAARARQLAHEHIVRVYDWAQDPATSSYFIIMECLEGEDLDSLLAREPALGLERSLALLRPVAAALDHAWERHQLVHRDIKPANVFLTRAGDVKLLDFGIAARARAVAAAAAAGVARGAGQFRHGRLPRARSGARGRRRAPARALDVHAVAIMLYRMLAGRLPFGAARAADAVPARPEGLNDAQWLALQAGFAASAAARPASVGALLDRIEGASGPSETELQAQVQEQVRAGGGRGEGPRQREAQAQAEAQRRAAEASGAQAHRSRSQGRGPGRPLDRAAQLNRKSWRAWRPRKRAACARKSCGASWRNAAPWRRKRRARKPNRPAASWPRPRRQRPTSPSSSARAPNRRPATRPSSTC